MAIKYIDFFDLKAGASLLRELYKSGDNSISKEAMDLMNKLDISLSEEEL